MFDGREKRQLTKMLWSVSIKIGTFASVNTCSGSFKSCSDEHSITLTQVKNNSIFY